jgi:cell shape-determining protein MreC
MISRIGLLIHSLKLASTPRGVQTSITAAITPAMVHKFETAVAENLEPRSENQELRVENENLRVKSYELKRELEEAHRQLWSREINNK